MTCLPVLTFLLMFYSCLCSKYEFFTRSPNAVQHREINDCAGLKGYYPESASGVYTINPSDMKGPMMVSCDMTTDGGGWTVIQRRYDGSVNFNRPWSDYQQGFGNENKEFWLGNENIHRLTSWGNVELKIVLTTSAHGQSHSVHYKSFSVGDVSSLYELWTEGFSGDLDDALLQHNCMKFSAIDFDADKSSRSCAASNHGGWWFNNCQTANLNADYSINTPARIMWKSLNVLHIAKTEMKIRPNPKYTPTGHCNHHEKLWKDCEEIHTSLPSAPSGVYTMDPDGNGPFNAYCDMDTRLGGWTVIQRRADGSVNFTRTFQQYKVGFGDLKNEFYLGNEIIHRLTEHKKHKLLFILEDFNGTTTFENYNSFYVSREVDFYRVAVGDPKGTAGDSFTYHNGQQFSTFDSDHDADRIWHCAKTYKGGWWYKSCEISNLNGVYNSTKPFVGVVWKTFRGTSYSLKSSTMTIKPTV